MGGIDVDRMDLIKRLELYTKIACSVRYPGWREVEWSYADLEPGDCREPKRIASKSLCEVFTSRTSGRGASETTVYAPRYHQVTAYPGRSINVHVWCPSSLS